MEEVGAGHNGRRWGGTWKRGAGAGHEGRRRGWGRGMMGGDVAGPRARLWGCSGKGGGGLGAGHDGRRWGGTWSEVVGMRLGGRDAYGAGQGVGRPMMGDCRG